LLEHGGGLRAAATRYGIALGDWLDLSTGINPHGWPVPPVPPTVWQRLPEMDDGLEAVAAAYYGTAHLLTTAGSQAAIQALPRLREPGRIGVFQPCYAEHAHAWQQAGHQVELLLPDQLDAAADRLDALVLVNPNNPTGEYFDPARLLNWQVRLAEHGGWLVVDEAFMDATPDHSLTPQVGLPGLIVLRSLGKFFGLAGARVGFTLAQPALLDRLQDVLGPWPVTGPSRWVAQQVLADHDRQAQTRRWLKQAGQRLAELLRRQRLPVGGGTALFQWVPLPEAGFWQDALARRGILVRHFVDPPSLRFGLPGTEPHWRRLELALAGVRAERLC